MPERHVAVRRAEPIRHAAYGILHLDFTPDTGRKRRNAARAQVAVA
jgi:hypothetical protein